MVKKALGTTLSAAVIAVLVTSGVVYAHGDADDHGYPPYGMGYGMGHGMMGGHGMGHGMMGGHGMGHGMMGAGPGSGLDLSSEQRKQIHGIRSELRKKNWALQGKIIDEQEKLFELYADETPDAKKIGAVYEKIFDLRRQMIEASIDAQNRQRAVLTDEQREHLRQDRFGYSEEHKRMHRELASKMLGG